MNPTAEEIAALVRQGNKIEAIKLLREASGMGLKEAKDFIERDASPAALAKVVRHPLKAPSGIGSAEVRRLMAEDKLIDAIKLLREETGLSLKDAKDVLEAMRPPKPAAVPASREGFPLKWVIAALLAIAVCAALYALGIRPG